MNCCNLLPGSSSDVKHLKFRHEFVRDYSEPLPCKIVTDEDAAVINRADRHLKQVVIVKFVQLLDSLQLMPIDSRGLTAELHHHGINVRDISLIARDCKLPYVRSALHVEMIARSFKQLHRQAMRQAILRYRSVGAVSIE